MNLEQRISKGPRACTTCAKAKSRCIPGPSSNKCERCHRLQKPCGTQTAAPPRRRKEPRRTKVQELERRLEHLTSRLESASGTAISYEHPAISLSTDQSPPVSRPISPLQVSGIKWRPQGFRMNHLFPRASSSALDSANLNEAPSAEGASKYTAPTPESTPSTEGQANPLLSPCGSVMNTCSNTCGTMGKSLGWVAERNSERHPWPEGLEAEEYLFNYRKHAANLLPFVVIPSHMSAAQLLVERPYLWKGVMLHSCHVDGQRQLAASTSLVKDIITASFCEAVKGFDMLQGLIVMIAWFHYNLNSTQVTNILFLARGMIATLSLCEKVAALQQRPPLDLTPTELDETRALAGVYYILTLYVCGQARAVAIFANLCLRVFTANKKPDSLMDPRHIESCCAVLESRLQAPGDLLAVYLCRIQILSQSLITSATDPNHRTHHLNLIKSFREKLPPLIANDPTLNCHIHTAKILLYEPALDENPLQYLLPSARIPLLWQTLQAAKEYLGLRMSMPLSEHPRFISMSCFDHVYAFIICLKLVLLDVPGWDILMVKHELNLEPLIDTQIREMEILSRRRLMGAREAADKSLDPSPEIKQQDPFHRLGVKLRQLKFLFHIDQPEPPVQSQSPDLGPAASVDPTISCIDVDMGMDLDFGGSGTHFPPLDGFDPAYWHDLFGDDAMQFYCGHTHTHDTSGGNSPLVMDSNMEGIDIGIEPC